MWRWPNHTRSLTYMDTFTVKDFRPGERVQLHPATDLWMRGIRYGTVTLVGRLRVTVQLDVTNRFISILPRDILRIVD